MVVTRADIYEKVIFAERPLCPHCGQEMKIWQCAKTPYMCGARWGSPYLFVCLNDACPPFVKGWERMKKDHGRTCSYRCICYPDSEKTETMLVFSPTDCKAGIIDEAVVAADRAKGTPEDPEVQALMGDFERQDVSALKAKLYDDSLHYKVRQKAATLMGELGLVETIELLQNQPIKDQRIRAKVGEAIKRIHEINGTQECPYCKEITDAGTTTCQHCGRRHGQ